MLSGRILCRTNPGLRPWAILCNRFAVGALDCFGTADLRRPQVEDEDDDEEPRLLSLSRRRLERSGFPDHRRLFPDEPIKRRAVDAFGL
jgi:hypothetical protein